MGKHVQRWITQPVVDSHINFLIFRKRKAAGFAKKAVAKEDIDAAMAQARRKRQEIRERAKRARLKKKKAQLDIVLSIEVSKKKVKGKKDTAPRVQLRDKTQGDLFSRTMIMERRYAILVGFIWNMIGLIMLL